jgi:hypothetical protein
MRNKLIVLITAIILSGGIIVNVNCQEEDENIMPNFWEMLQKSPEELELEQMKANMHCTESHVQTIALAIETYKVAYGSYPLTEDELLSPKSGPPFLSMPFDNQTIFGYHYDVDLGEDNYKITATPERPNKSGSKIFILEKGKELITQECEETSSPVID